MARPIKAIDLFCGAGGSSLGLAYACSELDRQVNLLAINHWDIAIDTHSSNLPQMDHICAPLHALRPTQVVYGRPDIMIASPECIYHSVARGGKPINDQRRSSAWEVVRWAEELKPRRLLVENVREFRGWGPCDTDGNLIKERSGEIFDAFINALRAIGYNIDYRVITCADYGDPTVRKRLFIQGKLGKGKIRWPEQTHFKDKAPYWIPAKSIIDWETPGQSIFGRKKPLSPNTIRRIIAGLEKFGGPAAEPFLLMLYNMKDAKADSRYTKKLDVPCPTVTAGGQHIGLVQPFIVPNFGERKGQTPRTHSVDDPLPTITSHGAGCLVSPFITQYQGQSVGQGLDTPLNTVTTQNKYGLVLPFIMKYYGTAVGQSVDQPLDTVTAKGRFALVEAIKNGHLDIRFRMLTPRELARATSFPDDYSFTGTKTQTIRQIGNAVPTQTSKALCKALLAA
jgi:DNA (cytosine-5)-methyltransferase 1